MNLSQLIVDPSTGEPSCSRFGLLLMNIGAFLAAGIMLYIGRDPTSLVTGMAVADAGVYGVNSVGRFFKRGPIESDTPGA